MKIILFGSTGMLGNYVYKVLVEKYIVLTITRKEFDIENDLWSKLDGLLQKEYNDVQTIINCAGIIPQNCPTLDYRKYIRINTLFPHKLQELSKEYNYKFIHITTDCVYDGLKGNYNETDVHSETGIYGVSKSLGEPEDACIIRTSIIGEEVLNKKGLLEWIISQQNKEINGYTNHMWNGVTCLSLAEIIKDIIDANKYWVGVRHIYSPNSVSKYDICVFINEIYNLNISISKYTTAIINKSLVSHHNCVFINTQFIHKQIILQKIYNLTIHIFGKNSFIGSSIYDKLHCNNKKLYSHAQIDIFKKNINNNDIIINCCGVPRGDNQILYESNYIFVKTLIDVVNFHKNITFINISSLACSDLSNTTFYAKTKLQAENYIINNLNKNNKFTILRLCNILGDGIKPYNNSFIYTLLYEKKLNMLVKPNYNIYNDELYIISIEDVIDVIIECIAIPKNKILNIISDEKYYLHDIIKIIYNNEQNYIKKYNINLHDISNKPTYDSSITNIVKNCDIKKVINNLYNNIIPLISINI
jgi:dTDP-4-dehydrorhamnose reductase